ncbi:relaxase, partial [Nostoc sp. UHCC 0870]
GSVNEDDSPRLLWKQGGNLNKYKCSFAKLQTELGISYDPQRDDNEIKRLNKFLESVNNQPNNQQIISTISAANSPVIAEINPQIYPASSEVYQPESVALPLVAQSEKRQLSQKAINAIAEFIDSSSLESVLDEALPSVNQSLDQYQQSLAEVSATFNQLQVALTQADKHQLSQKAINTIAEFIEQSTIESVLEEALPSVIQELEQYQQESAKFTTTFNELKTAINQVEKHQLSQKAINAIAEFIEQSTIESVLEEALPSVIQELEEYQQESAKFTTTFNKLTTAINQVEKHQLSQKAINAIAEFIEQSTIESALVKLLPVLKELSESQSDTIIKPLSQIVEKFNQLPKLLPSETQTLTDTKPKLKEELRAKLYNYYSADLQNLLVTDRDKEIATRALLDNKPVQDIEEILLASPAGWTDDEAKALVLIAQNKLASRQEQSEQRLFQKQQLQSEYLAIAVPVAVELINWQLKENGENSLRFKRATLSKQGKELVFTHDERGEIFRLKVNRNQLGELEYSVVNIAEVSQSDIETWEKAEQILLEYLEHKQQQSMTRTRGLSR